MGADAAKSVVLIPVWTCCIYQNWRKMTNRWLAKAKAAGMLARIPDLFVSSSGGWFSGLFIGMRIRNSDIGAPGCGDCQAAGARVFVAVCWSAKAIRAVED